MNKLDEILLKHEIYPDYLGYEYIKYIVQDNIDIGIGQIRISPLYQFAAIRFDTSPASIERNIRSVLNKSQFKGLTNKRALAILQLEYRGEN